MRIFGLPEAVGPRPRLLILGSFPGRRSLELGEYYAHPRNQFWKLVAEICAFDRCLPYTSRLERLIGCGIGLWDSLHACEREGSLDASILAGSEVPNDLNELFLHQATIRAAAFNGQKSWDTFKKFILPTLPSEIIDRLALLPLPSTSPANTHHSYQEKLAAWSSIRSFLV